MEQYIPKSVVVAEINRVLNSYHPNEITSGRYALAKLRDFLDTLEVKNVDLENEIKSSMYNLCELGCYTQSLLDNPDDYEGFARPFPKEVDDELADFARHFFELGLKAQKGE